MSLNIKNSQVRDFYEENIAFPVQFTEDAIVIHKYDRALTHLENIQNEIDSLKAIFPNALDDIQAIEKVQAELQGRVEQMLPKSEDPISHDEPQRGPVMSASAPVGIVNGNNNCGYNSLVQSIANTPSLKERFAAPGSPYKGFYDSYAQAQVEGEQRSRIDANQVRKVTSEAALGSQVDAGEELGHMLEKIVDERDTQFEMGDGYLYTKYGHDILTMQFNQIQNFERDVQRVINEARSDPETLIVGAPMYQLETNEAVPIRGEVPTKIDTQGGAYELTSCVIQQGNASGGHYITVQKKPDGWYLIDDTVVEKITQQRARQELQNGYQFFYEKTDQIAQPVPIDLEPAPSGGGKPGPFIPIPGWAPTIVGTIFAIGVAAAYL